MSDVLEDEKVDTTRFTEDGDHDVFSHYVKKSDILRAQIENIPCKALCGKQWVPHRDEEKYPVCPDCKRVYETMRSE